VVGFFVKLKKKIKSSTVHKTWFSAPAWAMLFLAEFVDVLTARISFSSASSLDLSSKCSYLQGPALGTTIFAQRAPLVAVVFISTIWNFSYTVRIYLASRFGKPGCQAI